MKKKKVQAILSTVILSCSMCFAPMVAPINVLKVQAAKRYKVINVKKKITMYGGDQRKVSINGAKHVKWKAKGALRVNKHGVVKSTSYYGSKAKVYGIVGNKKYVFSVIVKKAPFKLYDKSIELRTDSEANKQGVYIFSNHPRNITCNIGDENIATVKIKTEEDGRYFTFFAKSVGKTTATFIDKASKYKKTLNITVLPMKRGTTVNTPQVPIDLSNDKSEVHIDSIVEKEYVHHYGDYDDSDTQDISYEITGTAISHVKLPKMNFLVTDIYGKLSDNNGHNIVSSRYKEYQTSKYFDDLVDINDHTNNKFDIVITFEDVPDSNKPYNLVLNRVDAIGSI